MKPGKNLLIALLAAWCFTSAAAAQVADEPFRTQTRKSPSPQPTQLQVELMVEGDTPFEPNKPVQFAVRAEPWAQELEYLYYFGDGPPTGWLRDSRFPHTYTRPGSYQVYVEVRLRPGLGTAMGPTKSNVLTIHIQRREEAISVRLEMLDGPPFQVGKALRLVARPERTASVLEYQFHFGDGRSSAWTRESVATHVYEEAGTYQAVVSIREQAREGRPASGSTSSNRVLISVGAQSESSRPKQLLVRLNALPPEVQVGEPVRLKASIEPEAEGLDCIFEFGDEHQSERQAERTAEYRYATPGVYEALVRVYKGDRMVAESASARITVASPRPEHMLFLEADTRDPQVNGRVRFTWRIEPPLEGVLYLVEFGDSESAWVSQGAAEHAYTRPGEYRVLIRAKIGGKEIRSNDVLVIAHEAEQSFIYILIAIALGVAGATVAVWGIVARTKRRKRVATDLDGTAGTASVHASVVVRPHPDPGLQEVEFASPGPKEFEVRLQPVHDRGTQVMDQGFIKLKKK